ncbi:ectoine/hydroxyectoine ABC transporter substrate-binding protein EhuB [Brevibacillus humidisoli]|uniref:ectoine/hydroxyectoine ABC transporter substrate-binding protein EhuB n=1 Tax=Brevibacillus humidisoli TaxID=2895522 RepID=UPI001E512285|nr:ectoine/hydroxyectoine ABC transporter substrate-binding protein EhuB [Brevibacillus humidisoli]UFJ40263.1 ectoine/hydroxyectoine ABC transporter substrate-binding protein EhuB [Brevibacillus humidisoli]
MKKFFHMLITLMMVGVLVGCGTQTSGSQAGTGDQPSGDSSSGEQSAETTLAKIKSAGKVTVGFANEKPYAYKDENGKLTGEAVEIARTILNKMGVKEMEPVLVEFGALIPGLKAKRFDMITAGMYITPDRCKSVAFAEPEYSIGEALAVKKGNPLNLKSYEDIVNNKEAKVAVMAGAAEEGYLKKMGAAEDQIVIVPDQPAAIKALQSDRVHAITMTGPSLQAVLDSANDDTLERVMDFDQPVIDGKGVRGYGATAFRQEDTALREAFNAELKKLKESGELLNIIKPFGFTEQELPGDMTAEKLCKPE